MRAAFILEALTVLASLASGHKPGLTLQQPSDYTNYASTSKKPNVLFIFTDDQGDQLQLNCDQTMLIRGRLALEFHGVHAHSEEQDRELRSHISETLLHQFALLSVSHQFVQWEMRSVRTQ